MGNPRTRGMFHNFTYQKTVDELKEAMTNKVAFLIKKVAERETRIARIREEYDITDADMITLLTQAANQAVSNARMPMSYNLSTADGNGGDEVRLVAAGVVQNLITEKTLIEEEQGSITHLERIVRNLKPVMCFGANGEAYVQDSFSLGDGELDFLGF